MTLSSLLLILVLGSLAVSALPYGKNSDVIELTKDNFAKQVFSSEHVWLVEFYAPCGHCKQLAPEWEKAATNLKGIVKVAAVNCDEEKELAQHFGVQGFPTIKLFPSNLTPTPDKKGVVKNPEDYRGQRTARDLVNFALSKLPNFVTQVSAKNSEEWLGKTDLAKALLFTDKPKTTDLYKAIAIDFHHQIHVGQVKDTETALVERFGVSKFPTLLVVPAEGGDAVVYDGKLNHDDLFNFLKPYAKMPTPPKGVPKQEKAPSAPSHDPLKEVHTKSDFSSICEEPGGNCLLIFLDPENTPADEHSRYLSVIDAISKKHGSFFHILWLNAQAQQDFVQKFALFSGFPTAVIYNREKQALLPFVGSFTEESLSEFLGKVKTNSGRSPSKLSKLPTFVDAEASVVAKNIPTEEETKDEL